MNTPDLPNLFNRKYAIIGRIGRGATKTVWMANDTVQERDVALKVFDAQNGSARNLEAIARNEAIALTRIGRHPRIAAIYDANIDTETGRFFIAEEYVEGENLAEHLKTMDLMQGSGRRLLFAYARDILSGLQHLHRQGMVHGDLKLENILIAGKRAKITDFGSSIVPGKEAASPGTLRYLPPESVDGGKRTSAGDIWQFGVLLYRATTGMYPFNSSKDDWTRATDCERERYQRELLHAIVDGHPLRPRRLNDRIPMRLDELIIACLRKDPSKRPSARRAWWCISPWYAKEAMIVVAGAAALTLALLPVANRYVRSTWSDDRVLLVSRQEGAPRLYELDTNLKPHRPAFTSETVSHLALSPDSRTLAYITGPQAARAIVFRDTTTGQEHRTGDFQEPSLPVWSPDGTKLAVYARAETPEVIVLNRDQTIGSRIPSPALTELCWHPSGTYLSGLANGTVTLFNEGRSRPATEYPTGIRTHIWTPRGLLLSVSDIKRPPHILALYQDDKGIRELAGGNITKIGTLRDQSGFWYLNHGMFHVRRWNEHFPYGIVDISELQLASGKKIVAAMKGKDTHEWYLLGRTEDLDGSGTLDAGDDVLWKAVLDPSANADGNAHVLKLERYPGIRALEELLYLPKR